MFRSILTRAVNIQPKTVPAALTQRQLLCSTRRLIHSTSIAKQQQQQQTTSSSSSTVGLLSKLQQQQQANNITSTQAASGQGQAQGQTQKKKVREEIVKYVIHCKFTKNNTLITFTSVLEDLNFEINNPQLSFNEKVMYYINLPEKTLITLTSGNVGFRKWQRGEYEAGYKTASRLFQMIEDRNYLNYKNAKIEIIFQNFGKGRRAFEDALLGKPGNLVRNYITRVSDKTKIKFGGVKSPKPRRL